MTYLACVQHPTLMSHFGARSTAADVVRDRDLSGKLAFLTGGNSGLGLETVKALAGAGCEVLFTSRNKAVGDDIAQSISKASKVAPAIGHSQNMLSSFKKLSGSRSSG